MVPLAKNVKRRFSLKEIVIAVLAVVISVSAGVAVFTNLKKDVSITQDGQLLEVRTMKATVKEVLEQNGISIAPEDYINMPLETKLQRIGKNQIIIKRAIPVSIFADGQETQVKTYKETVGEVLKDSPVKLNSSDKLDGCSAGDKVTRNMSIKIVRVTEELIKQDISIPFKAVRRENRRMDKGVERVVTEGKEGTRQKVFKVVYEDGKETIRELIKDAVISNPINKITEFGTILNFKTARGEVVRYTKVLEMRSTAYTASYKDTGKSPGDPHFGITYTGIKVKKGVIAVDPDVIPLGTRVYIETEGKGADYGFAVAADVGSAIQGKLIDLYMDSQTSANSWGCRRVKVYILAK